MSSVLLVNPIIKVNNETVKYIPDTFKFCEGLGDYAVNTYTTGGGRTRTAPTKDLKTAKGMMSFSIPTLFQEVNLAKQWKQNFSNNVVTASEMIGGELFTRTLTNAVFTNNYEVKAGTDAMIEINFEGDPLI
jgi:hypothetical protein